MPSLPELPFIPAQSVQAWDIGDLSAGPEGAPRPRQESFEPMWGGGAQDSARPIEWSSLLEDFSTLDSPETSVVQPNWTDCWQLDEFPDDGAVVPDAPAASTEMVDQSELFKELFEERQRLEQERAEVERQRAEVAALLKQTQAETQNLLAQARLQAAAKVDDAHVQNEMLQAAFQEKLAQQQEQVTEHLNTARSIAGEARAWRDNLYAQGETTMLQLVIRIGQTLFGDGFALDPTTLGRAFARALAEGHMLGALRIYVNPADAAQLSPYWLEQQAAISGQKIELAPSDSIKRGGCYIDGQFGAVDALVESQFQAVRETLMANMPVDRGELA